MRPDRIASHAATTGLAVLFTTHDPNQALRHAHQVLLIRGGGTLAYGSAADLIEQRWLEQLYASGAEVVGNGEWRAFLPR